MAAKTPYAVESEALLRAYGPPTHIFHFDGTVGGNIDNTDTFASGLSGVTHFAWESDASDTVQVNVTHSAGTFTFASAADNATGRLIVWARR
jgi:hypothetical protein